MFLSTPKLVSANKSLQLSIRSKAFMNKLLTVITSIYNKGDRTRASVQSILDQTYQDFEYIIIKILSTS